MLAFFATLGHSLEEAWAAVGRDRSAFAALACRALERHAPASQVTVDDIFDWFFAGQAERADAPSPAHVPVQSRNAGFGQPPIKLYQGSDFYIEALFWMTGTTSIHQHGFSGAFTPLVGSSVCSTFRFVPARELDESFYLGALEREHTEMLRPGDVRAIYAGPGLIHQLFHLEQPSVTIVVRTEVEPGSLPQLAYLPPGLAMDGFRDDRVIARQLALLGVMIDAGLGDVERYASRILARQPREPVFRVLSYLVARGVDSAMLDRLLAVARQRHGDLVDVFHQAARHQRRIALITQLRESVADAELRFFLALLMLLPDRDSITAIIAARYPDRDPIEQIMAWARRLSGVDRVGVEFDELNTTLLRGLLCGRDADGLLRDLAEEYEPDDVVANRQAILDHAGKLASSEIFAPLFSASKAALAIA